MLYYYKYIRAAWKRRIVEESFFTCFHARNVASANGSLQPSLPISAWTSFINPCPRQLPLGCGGQRRTPEELSAGKCLWERGAGWLMSLLESLLGGRCINRSAEQCMAYPLCNVVGFRPHWRLYLSESQMYLLNLYLHIICMNFDGMRLYIHLCWPFSGSKWTKKTNNNIDRQTSDRQTDADTQKHTQYIHKK